MPTVRIVKGLGSFVSVAPHLVILASARTHMPLQVIYATDHGCSIVATLDWERVWQCCKLGMSGEGWSRQDE
jgi:multidrug transporter EmrE-like cation transporter